MYDAMKYMKLVLYSSEQYIFILLFATFLSVNADKYYFFQENMLLPP